MDLAVVPTVSELLAGAAGTEQPLLTYYDDATGERTELTAAALGSWSARTAALLGDGCGLRAGDRAAVLLPPHWQTAAVLLGAWSTGIAVSFQPAATAGLPVYGPGAEEPLDATFVSAARLDDWLENVPAARHRFVLGLAPGAAELPEVPTGYHDYLAEVRRYPATAPAYDRVTAGDAATVDGTTFQQWASVAEDIARDRGVEPGDRVLIDAAAHEQPATWLLTPLLVGASVVLCANLDPATVEARVAVERVTKVL